MKRTDPDSRPLIPPPSSHRPGMLAALRASFLTGMVVILPIALTIWLIWTVTGWIDSFVLPLVPYRFRPEHYIGIDLRGVGVIFLLVFTVIVGWLAKGLIGRSLIRWAESLVDRMPVVRSVYNAVKQIAETIFSQSGPKFDRACLIEYPRPGLWALAFVSSEAKGEVSRRIGDGETVLSVFLPTTPNPTSGFLLYVRESEVAFLDMTVEDAAKLVISAGLVYPAEREPAAPGAPPPVARGGR
ncbi:DUF502 domain-containing protein [Frigidibacter oleivorans]|uniref:DUF502 domain-containing protein n=1 Tax=Frigidibacter oleivorans TaxID=2487129 RepID=UPI000F8DE7B0|nr:DUF502 domain-containing protein [Frigidibacter oleivorans]